MRQIEPDPTAVNGLMMGPDGAVYVIPTGTQEASPPPGEMEGRTAERDTGLPGVRRVPGQGTICFSYSARVSATGGDDARRALRDVRRMPTGGICFSYSAGVPTTDRDAAQRTLRDIRRMPQGPICFSY
jgi:hypothetical protein